MGNINDRTSLAVQLQKRLSQTLRQYNHQAGCLHFNSLNMGSKYILLVEAFDQWLTRQGSNLFTTSQTNHLKKILSFLPAYEIFGFQDTNSTSNGLRQLQEMQKLLNQLQKEEQEQKFTQFLSKKNLSKNNVSKVIKKLVFKLKKDTKTSSTAFKYLKMLENMKQYLPQDQIFENITIKLGQDLLELAKIFCDICNKEATNGNIQKPVNIALAFITQTVSMDTIIAQGPTNNLVNTESFQKVKIIGQKYHRLETEYEIPKQCIKRFFNEMLSFMKIGFIYYVINESINGDIFRFFRSKCINGDILTSKPIQINPEASDLITKAQILIMELIKLHYSEKCFKEQALRSDDCDQRLQTLHSKLPPSNIPALKKRKSIVDVEYDLQKILNELETIKSESFEQRFLLSKIIVKIKLVLEMTNARQALEFNDFSYEDTSTYLDTTDPSLKTKFEVMAATVLDV